MSQSSKIARLPYRVREQLNLRLESAEEGPSVLPWLNGLRAVKKILDREFDGKPINKQNLSHWRQHGYQTWLIRRELWKQAAEARELSNQIDSEHSNILADDVVNVTAARYASMLLHWDGKPDEKFHSRVRTLDLICRGAVRMQRSMHRAREANEQAARQHNEDERREAEDYKHRMVEAVMGLSKVRVVSEFFGGGELGNKLASYIYRIQNDLPFKFNLTPEDLIGKKKSRKPSNKPAPDPESAPSDPSIPCEEASSVVNPGQASPAEETPPQPDVESKNE